METLLYFGLWAALIFLMMRFGCGAHVMGRGHGHGRAGTAAGPDAAAASAGPLRWTPPARDIDPVCGKSVATARAKSSVFEGLVYYFCSRDCREVFEAAPEVYVAARDRQPPPQQLEHHHG